MGENSGRAVRSVAVGQAFGGLTFLAARTPVSEERDYFATLALYRDGAIFIAHYAGSSEWERHCAGDEIVFVLEGSTTIILRAEGTDERIALGALQLVVVPRAMWHRFETPHAVKVLSVTPQPTDHTATEPNEPNTLTR